MKGHSLRRDGYVKVRVAPNRWELEHRVVMERTLGRALRPGEVVHHKNHVRDDNRPENLEVCASPGIHLRDHHPQPPYWTGRHLSKEHRLKVSRGNAAAWRRGRKHSYKEATNAG